MSGYESLGSNDCPGVAMGWGKVVGEKPMMGALGGYLIDSCSSLGLLLLLLTAMWSSLILVLLFLVDCNSSLALFLLFLIASNSSCGVFLIAGLGGLIRVFWIAPHEGPNLLVLKSGL